MDLYPEEKMTMSIVDSWRPTLEDNDGGRRLRAELIDTLRSNWGRRINDGGWNNVRWIEIGIHLTTRALERRTYQSEKDLDQVKEIHGALHGYMNGWLDARAHAVARKILDNRNSTTLVSMLRDIWNFRPLPMEAAAGVTFEISREHKRLANMLCKLGVMHVQGRPYPIVTSFGNSVLRCIDVEMAKGE